jgi:hypothetical protein
MHPSLTKFGTTVFGIAMFLAVTLLPILYIYGSVLAAAKILPILSVAVVVVLAVCLNIFLPMSLFRFTREASCKGFFVSSYIFGAALWLAGVAVAYDFWGFYGLLIGLIIAGVGVVPVAMLAAALLGEWLEVCGFVLAIVLTFGLRLFAIYLASKVDRDTMPKNHSLAWWAAKTDVGLCWLIIIFGYSATLYYDGWEYFTPVEGHFNMFVSCLVTMIIMLPGVGIAKLGEYFERKRQAKAPLR